MNNGFATTGQRLGAYAIDVLIGMVIWGAFFALVLATHSIYVFVLYYVVIFAYGITVWALTATKGYTPGKKLLGLRVVDETTLQPIGWGRAFLRSLVFALEAVPCGIGLLITGIQSGSHPKHQTWHDQAVRSIVVSADVLTTPPPVPQAPPAEGVLPVGLPTSGPPTSALPPAPAPPTSMSPVQPPMPPVPPPAVQPGPAPLPPMPARPAVPPPDTPSAVPPPPPTGLIGPPPGTPTTGPSVADTFIGGIPQPPNEPEPVADAAEPAAPEPTWLLEPVIGQAQAVVGKVLIGRDPDVALAPGADRWAVDDPQRTVSKTHALVAINDDALTVEDWNSTNGVVLRRGGADTELEPRHAATIENGDILLLGDFEIRVRRG